MSRLIIAVIIFLISLYLLLGIQTKMSVSESGALLYAAALLCKVAALVLSLLSIILNLQDRDVDVWLTISGLAALLGIWLGGWLLIIAPFADVIHPVVPYAQ